MATTDRIHPTRRLLLGACLAVVLVLSACSGGSTSTPPSGRPIDTAAPVKLTWWTGQEAEAQKALDGLAKSFTAQHPNVTIDVSSGASTTEELLQKLSATFLAGTYPDISYAYGNWATELADSERMLDLTAVAAEPASAWQDFPASSRQTATVRDKVIGFPAVVGNLGVIYNPTLFAAAGVPEPTPDWTWEDFRVAAKQITDPAKNVYGTAYSVSGSEDTTWHFWPLLWQNGGSILSEDGKKSAFSSPAGVTGLELLRRMAVEDKSVYLDQTDEKYAPLFASGRIGMMINGPWTLYDLVAAKTPYRVTVLPGTDGDHQTSSATDLWVGLDHDDSARGYWVGKFLQYLATPSSDQVWNLAQGNLPLRPSELTSPAFQQYVRDYPGADVFLQNLTTNAQHAKPTISGYVELSGYVGKAVARVLQGAASPQQALAEAAKQADLALADQ